MSDFRKLLGVRFLFQFAVNTQAVILGWLMYTLTHEPLNLGMIGLAEAVPALGLAIFAGYLVDRSRPQVVYRNVLLGSLVSAGIVWLSQSPWLALSTSNQVLALYASSFTSGVARGFAQPAMYAVVPRLMPRDDLGRASAWLGLAMQIASVLGPAVGGLVFGWFDAFTAAALPCLFLIPATVLWTLISVRIPAPAQSVKKPIGQELMSGAAFVFRHPILLPALSLDMLSVLFGGVEALLPIFASDILGVGARGLGVLRAAPALGAAVTGLILTRLDFRARAGSYLFTAVFGFGICILVFGLSRNYWLSLVALGLSGAFDGVSAIIRSTAVQLVSPDHMRGRISAINSIFIGSSNELGEFESGVAAHFFGTVPAVIFGGIACLMTVTVVAFRSKALRGLHLGELESGTKAPG